MAGMKRLVASELGKKYLGEVNDLNTIIPLTLTNWTDEWQEYTHSLLHKCNNLNM